MMNADILYKTAFGRALFKVLQKTGAFRLAAKFLHTRASKRIIPGYIKKNGIDMRPFEGQTYNSFAAFFGRTMDNIKFDSSPNALISPCDSQLTVYGVTEELTIPMKGSVYGICDLVPDDEIAKQFNGGLCLVFRLEASDYHHFCCFDGGKLIKTNFIPGQLHSVQPVAINRIPVFRLNRRWWSVLETENFGTAVQIEVGAMAVGGVTFSVENGHFSRGDEMGNFELAGSTILLLLNSSVRERLRFNENMIPALNGESEVRVRIGSSIGELINED